MPTATARQSSPVSTASTADPVQRARALAPTLRERALDGNVQRRVADRTIRDLWDAQLWYLLKPQRFGGPEMRPDVMYEVAGELAQGDGSAAWVYAIMSIHDLFLGYFPEQAQHEYWETPSLSASSFSPGGKATPARGGFRLSGKWSFCSGVDNAQWMILNAVFGMLDTQPPMPDVRFVLLPIGDCKILDDWHVLGLRGTGSKSVAVEDVFVPEHRVLGLGDLSRGTAPGGKVHASPIFRTPVWAVFPFTISSPATGIARGAMASFIDQMRTRETAFDHSPVARKPGVQMHLAEAGAMIDAAELLYRRSLRETLDTIFSVEELTVEHRVRSRRDQAFSVRMAREAAQLLFNAQGGKGLHDTNPVQRAFRDLEALQAHIVGGWDMPALNYGSVMLGNGPTDPFF